MGRFTENVLRERNGLQNRHVLLIAGYVEAARFLGGQAVAPSMAKLMSLPIISRRQFFVPACRFR